MSSEDRSMRQLTYYLVLFLVCVSALVTCQWLVWLIPDSRTDDQEPTMPRHPELWHLPEYRVALHTRLCEPRSGIEHATGCPYLDMADEVIDALRRNRLDHYEQHKPSPRRPRARAATTQ